MPPRGFANPPAKTDSAREALSSFHCALCSKGYSRMPDYEAHLSSYDHSHRVRLQEMKKLAKDPMSREKARRAEEKANKGMGLISIKLGGGEAKEGVKKPAGAGFKKGGFKSAFAPVEGTGSGEEGKKEEGKKEEGKTVKMAGGSDESDTEEEGYEHYDPMYPTD